MNANAEGVAPRSTHLIGSIIEKGRQGRRHPFPHYPEALVYYTSDALDRMLGRKA